MVLTGSPGSGKTSLLEALGAEGYAVIELPKASVADRVAFVQDRLRGTVRDK